MVFTQRVQVTYTKVSSTFEFQVDFFKYLHNLLKIVPTFVRTVDNQTNATSILQAC